MKRCRGLTIVGMVGVTSVLAVAGVWTAPAPAAQRTLGVKTVAGTVSCATSHGALEINAYAYRPSVGYATAPIITGQADTAAAIVLVGVQSDKSSYTLDRSCSRTKVSIRFSHHGLSSAGVVKAGYYHSPTIYCGAPARVFVRYRIGFADSGKPATATITVWARRKKSSRLREITYVQWSPSKSVTYYSGKACVSQTY
ncbi:MAG: hypothetical protein ACXVRJ_10390 [Gaiellaceae bacterium]